METADKKEVSALHSEFQVERMILFSDAVFAIVITLMAIEIRLPEDLHISSTADLTEALKHLLPTILAYIVSFIFIGAIWYQHLKLFGFLKSFDKHIVFFNLLLLFFVGLFPFSATLISKASVVSQLPFYTYLGIIVCSLGALNLLEYQILIRKPHVRNNLDITEALKKYKERKLSFMIMAGILVLILITDQFIANEKLKGLSTSLFALFPVIYFILKKRLLEKKHE